MLNAICVRIIKKGKNMKNNILNSFKITIPAKSANEAFSRSLISAFVSQLDPTVEELCDIKTAVSEAVTNCIVHAYNDSISEDKKTIYISGSISKSGLLCIRIKDKGCGIKDINRALMPMYSGADNDERSGMGFSIMKFFTDKMKVTSTLGKGTTVTLKKQIGRHE